MTSDVTVTTGQCAVRTFTCTGDMAKIEVHSPGGPFHTVTDGGVGTSTLEVTCNADGTGWTFMGTKVTKVECSATPACKTCHPSLITHSTTGNGGHNMADVTVTTGQCAVRTFTCSGAMAQIEVHSPGGPFHTVTDGGTNVAKLDVICNGDGSGWTYMGTIVTKVVCSGANANSFNCAADLITITKTGNDAKDMESDVTDITGASAVRKFKCTGQMANIAVHSSAGAFHTATHGGLGTASLDVTCNADGTAWTFMGTTVTKVECSATPACKTCHPSLITHSTTGNGGHNMADVTVTTGQCAVRTFTCSGTMAHLEVHSPGGPFHAVDDAGTNVAKLDVVCNGDGSGWTYMGTTVTKVVCSEKLNG
ncbi:hypothetical protein PRIPAC_77934 [Pristionchus pacificus]|nr:hypothetical protein PRIPAC_77934 [Pristionchus pacificus]